MSVITISLPFTPPAPSFGSLSLVRKYPTKPVLPNPKLRRAAAVDRKPKMNVLSQWTVSEKLPESQGRSDGLCSVNSVQVVKVSKVG